MLNAALRSFHSRHILSRIRTLDARIASLPAGDLDSLALLQREKIGLRRALQTPPSL